MKDLLAARIRMGDEQAFELLFHKYYVRLCGFVEKYLDDPEEAREIAQEVFVRVWQERDRIDPDNCLKAYMFGIGRNLSLSRLRHLSVESAYTRIYRLVYLDRDEISVHDSLLAKELENGVAVALRKLPPRCREIFELSRNEGLKFREIAQTLRISVKTVETQISRALRIIHLHLAEYLGMLLAVLLMHFF